MQVDLEARVIGVGQVVGLLLLQAPGAGQAAGQRRQQQVAIQPGFLAQRERLGQRGEVHRHDDLVGELGEAAEAQWAEQRDRLAHRLEDRKHALEHRLVAADHDR